MRTVTKLIMMESGKPFPGTEVIPSPSAVRNLAAQMGWNLEELADGNVQG